MALATGESAEVVTEVFECCHALRRLSLFAPRPSTHDFCQITEAGCAGLRALRSALPGVDAQEEVSWPGEVGLCRLCQANTKTDFLPPRSASPPWGVVLQLGPNCVSPARCLAVGSPCTYAGCVNVGQVMAETLPAAVAQRVGVSDGTRWRDLLQLQLDEQTTEYVQEVARRVLCPYTSGEHGTYVAPLVQCYLTREPFRRLQTELLTLYTGLYAFYDVFSNPSLPKLIYCILEPRSTVHFPFYVCSSDGTWKLDPDVQRKQHVARMVRSDEAADKVADFYSILSDPSGTRLTAFERKVGVLYAPDGEFSAFLLGTILRMIPGKLGEIVASADPLRACHILAVPEGLRKRFDDLRALFPNSAEVLPSEITIESLFWKLGLLDPTTSAATERLHLLVAWMHSALSRAAESSLLFDGDWIQCDDAVARHQLEVIAASLRALGSERPPFELIEPLISLLLSKDETADCFGKRSRMGYENLFAHLVWREGSTAARSWVVVPLFSYPFIINRGVDYKHVGFFLGTLKDTLPDGTSLSPDELEVRLGAIAMIARAAARDYEELFLGEVLSNTVFRVQSGAAAVLSHELNRLISSGVQPALNDLKDLQERLSILERLRQKVEARIGPTSDHISRLERIATVITTGEPVVEPIGGRDWAKMVDDIKGHLTDFYGGKPLMLRSDVPKLFDPPLQGCAAIADYIIYQLVKNSWRHNQDSKDEAIQVDLRITTMEEGVRITVTDEGKGYPTEVLDRVMSPIGWNTTPLSDGAAEGKHMALQQVIYLAKFHGGAFRVENHWRDGHVSGARTTVELRHIKRRKAATHAAI